MWFQQICTQLIYTTSPSLSMIVTVAAELGPTCTPLEMRSSAMDRSSWKVSMVSMRSSFVMTTVKSALVRPAGKTSWYCCDTKSSPPWERKKELVNANVDVYKVWRCNYECLYTCDGGWSLYACIGLHATHIYIYLAYQQQCHPKSQQWLCSWNLLLERQQQQPQKIQHSPSPYSQHFQWKGGDLQLHEWGGGVQCDRITLIQVYNMMHNSCQNFASLTSVSWTFPAT